MTENTRFIFWKKNKKNNIFNYLLRKKDFKNNDNIFYFYKNNYFIFKKYFCVFFSALFVVFSVLSLSFGVCTKVEAANDNQLVSGEIDVIFNLNKTAVKPYIEAFQNKYPNCKVNYIPLYDYDQDIGDLIEKGEYGDVCFVPSYFTMDEVKKYFQPLDSMKKLEEKYNFLETAFSEEDTLYSIPSSAYLMGMIYNQNVFNQAGIVETPKTPEEFLDVLKQIKERTNATPMYSGLGLDWTFYNWTFFPYLEMTGDASYKGKFVHELDPFTKGGTFYDTYKLLYDAILNGYTENRENFKNDWYSICSQVHLGYIGCVVVGSWAMNQVNSAGESDDVISFMPFPNVIDGKQYATIMTDFGYGIPTNSDNPVAARAFIDFMLDESRFAIESDRISIVKTDPIPQSYGNLDEIIISTNADYQGNDKEIYELLCTGVNPGANESVKRIVQAAYGISFESFDGIMDEWNDAWENARPEDMETYSRDGTGKKPSSYDEELANTSVSVDPVEYEVSLSFTELEYLTEHPILKVGYLAEFAPYSYTEDGEFKGVSRDLLDGLANQVGVELEFLEYNFTKDMVTALNSGEIDMIAAYFIIGYHQKTQKISISYFETNAVLLRNDSALIDSSANNIQAILAGENNQLDLVHTKKYMSVFSYEEMLDVVDRKKADYAYTNYYTGQYYLRKFAKDHVEIVPAGEKVDVVFAYAQDVDTRLLSICNKFIYGLTDNYVQFSMMNHMNPPVLAVTWKRFVQTYSVQIIIVLVVIFILINLGIMMYMSERSKVKINRLIDAKKYEIMAQMMEEYIFEYYIKEKRLVLDQKFEEKFGYGRNIFKDKGAVSTDQALLLKLCEEAQPFDKMTSNPIELEDRDGVKEWFRVISYQVADDKKDTKQLIGKIVNVNSSVLETRRVMDEAERDPLTGIYNRKGFDNNLVKLIEERKEDEPVCLSIIDVDGFKQINDTLGHLGGDEALKILGGLLQKMTSDKVISCRFGGDEFMLVSFGLSEHEVSKMLHKLVTSMDTELMYNEKSCKISVSVGAYYCKHYTDRQTFFDKADHVLYSVKENGKNNFRIEVEPS